MSSTQITSAIGYNTTKMIFGNPITGTVPNANPNVKLTYRRIPIMTKNADGSIGELVFSTSELFSFGVSESKSFDDPNKINGYVMPLCLWNKNGPTDDEKAFTDTFDAVIERCKEYLLEQKEDLELYDYNSKSDFKKMNPIYIKREKGKIVEGSSPTLYAKLIMSRKMNKIITQFYDQNNDPIDAMSLMGKYCFVKAAIKFESIFVGAKIAVQVKLYEADVRLLETGMKRLLAKPKPESKVITSTNTLPFNELSNDPDGIENSDDEVHQPAKLRLNEPTHTEEPVASDKPTTKKVVKKVVKKN